MIEKLYNERTNSNQNIYALVSETSQMRIDPGGSREIAFGGATKLISIATTHGYSNSDQQVYGRRQDQGKEITPSRSSEFASTFISTIGFVPRAISNAVADTFKARSSRQTSVSVTATSASPEHAPTKDSPSIHPPLVLSPNLGPAERVEQLRAKIKGAKDIHIQGLNEEEMQIMLEDYKKILLNQSPIE